MQGHGANRKSKTDEELQRHRPYPPKAHRVGDPCPPTIKAHLAASRSVAPSDASSPLSTSSLSFLSMARSGSTAMTSLTPPLMPSTFRRAPSKRQPILWFNDYNHRRGLKVNVSYDGLLISFSNSRLYICNPATRQWTALPNLTGSRIPGLYPHTTFCIGRGGPQDRRRSGEGHSLGDWGREVQRAEGEEEAMWNQGVAGPCERWRDSRRRGT